MSNRAVHVAGHFGEFLQGRLGPDGPVVLVTVPCPVLEAVAHARSENGVLSGLDNARIARFLEALEVPKEPAIEITTSMPLGGGAGASTASLVAMGRLLGFDDSQIVKACLVAEGAVDPLMIEAPAGVLWSSREARVLRRLPSPPAMEIVGGFFGAPERTAAEDQRFPDIADLIEDWSNACAKGDLTAVASAASQSALRTSLARGPGDDPTASLAEKTGALGWARAHTGSARALIFPPDAVPEHTKARLSEAGFQSIVRFALT